MTVLKNSHKYDDIIHLPHPVSRTHPRMSGYDRAAQFSPFAALTGHEAAIKETARLTDEKIELDEYEKSRLDEKLQIIAENLGADMEVEITYFVPDEKKDGGAYQTVSGCVRKIDRYERVLVLKGEMQIPIEQILKII